MRGWNDWLWLKPLERIAPTWCYRTRDLYVVQGRYTRTLVVAEPPESVGPLWLSPLLELGGDVTVSIQAVPYTAGETTRLLRLRRTQHLSEMKERARLGRIDSPEERLRYESATRTEEHIRAGGTKLFHTGVAVTLRADTVRALAGLEQRAAEFFTRIGATAWPLTNEHPAGFRETAPTMRRLLARDMDFDTTTLAYSFLFNASNVGMPAGPIFGVSRRDRRPLRYDPWNRALGVEAPHVGILAPTGCVAGDTLLDGPDGARPIKELAEAGRPVRVWSLAEDGSVVAAQATAPFKKGVAPLYEFALDGGETITVTAHHRFLAPDGWQFAGSLRVGGRVAVGVGASRQSAVSRALVLTEPPVVRPSASSPGWPAALAQPHPGCAPDLPVSNPALDQPVRAGDAPRWSQTPPDCPRRCSGDHHQGDAQPREAGDSDPISSPSPDDARARSRVALRAGALDNAAAHSRACQWCDLPAKNHSALVSVPAKTSTVSLPGGWLGAVRRDQHLSVTQSRAALAPQTQGGPLHPSKDSVAAACSYPPNRIRYSTIISRRYVGTADYYDLHVPLYENYLAHGIWNHNTGKTVCAWNLVCELLCAGAGEDTPEQVILVDPKADYTRGVAYFGGVTLRWGVRESDGGTINALQINAGQDFTEVAQTVLGLIALATSTPAFPLSPATTGLWEAAIRGAYAGFGITANDPRSWLQTAEGAPRTPRDYPTLAHVYAQVAEGGPWDTPTLAQALYPWAMGTYARLVARPTTVDVAARVVSFDLESLTHGGDAAGRLRAVASFLIGVWTWGMARSLPAWRVLVLDEVETLLAHPETALLVGNWLALGRSYRLQVIHMSQRYTGYTATEQGKRAIENTPTLVFLQQAGGENIAQIAAAFALSAQRVKFLRSARKGTPGVRGTEALMVTPRGQEEIEILPPPEVLSVLLHGHLRAPGDVALADEARVLQGLARQMAGERD